MKKFTLLLICGIMSLMLCTSCIASARAYDYDEIENVVVADEVCYVYYTNPTTLFLNSLHIINGAYYYWHTNRYIPVVFPCWEVWSPHRFFYYDKNHWAWRDRYHGYNHLEYRRGQCWVDYRRSNIRHPNIIRPNRITPIKPQSNANRTMREQRPNNSRMIHRGGGRR